MFDEFDFNNQTNFQIEEVNHMKLPNDYFIFMDKYN